MIPLISVLWEKNTRGTCENAHTEGEIYFNII